MSSAACRGSWEVGATSHPFTNGPFSGRQVLPAGLVGLHWCILCAPAGAAAATCWYITRRRRCGASSVNGSFPRRQHLPGGAADHRGRPRLRDDVDLPRRGGESPLVQGYVALLADVAHRAVDPGFPHVKALHRLEGRTTQRLHPAVAEYALPVDVTGARVRVDLPARAGSLCSVCPGWYIPGTVWSRIAASDCPPTGTLVDVGDPAGASATGTFGSRSTSAWSTLWTRSSFLMALLFTHPNKLTRLQPLAVGYTLRQVARLSARWLRRDQFPGFRL